MIGALGKFLINPRRNQDLKPFSLGQFLFLILIQLSLVIVVLLLEELLFGIAPNKFSTNFKMMNEEIILFMILGSIAVPIMEEFLHRYYLNYRTKTILVSSSLLLLYFFSEYGGLNPIQNTIHFSAFLFLIVILVLKKKYHYTNLKLLVWGSILFFGLFHLSAYEDEVFDNNYLIIPVLVMPQIIGGLFLAFIRINFRFIHCVLFHGFFNLLLISIGAIGYRLFSP